MDGIYDTLKGHSELCVHYCTALYRLVSTACIPAMPCPTPRPVSFSLWRTCHHNSVLRHIPLRLCGFVPVRWAQQDGTIQRRCSYRNHSEIQTWPACPSKKRTIVASTPPFHLLFPGKKKVRKWEEGWDRNKSPLIVPGSFLSVPKISPFSCSCQTIVCCCCCCKAPPSTNALLVFCVLYLNPARLWSTLYLYT